jgi:choline dehydrogenase
MTQNTAASPTKNYFQRENPHQVMLKRPLKSHYDFIVCGAGSSGSVVARRLAENPSVDVLLVEAGGTDNVPSVMDPAQWPANIGSERDWKFHAEPNPNLNGRAIPMSMGKVLGGGSSINVMVWARGHRSDWDFFAAESDDPAWGYESVLEIYRNIENWQGAPDPQHRGTGGIIYVQPSPDPSPVGTAMLDAARELGIPTFASQNGLMMEGNGGCALTDVLIHNGERQSIFRAYVYPFLDRPNLTVLPETLVTRLVLEGKRVTGIEVFRNGSRQQIFVRSEVVLSLGAVHTPKVLMHSGIGDEAELDRFNIPVVHHLPGVGQNLQDHLAFGCIWEYHSPLAPRNTGNETTLYWKSIPGLDSPDMLFCQAEFPVPSVETATRGVPKDGWTIYAGLARPKSRGRVRVTSSDPFDPVSLETNMLEHPDDMKAAIACVKLCQGIGQSPALQPFVKREALPGNISGEAMEDFIRDAGVTFWHQTCTAKMGRDAMSVVDSKLKVYGIDKLRIADGSIMPRITTGNTMAPCVIIGERAAHILRQEYKV